MNELADCAIELKVGTGLTREWQIALGLGVVTINLAAYLRWWRQQRKS
ncbi:MAG: hypothetical protein HY847_01870 [Betaproteobacteria bacterium]|nr:hypothetical protein [Betaproteobacteria bacterium]